MKIDKTPLANPRLNLHKNPYYTGEYMTSLSDILDRQSSDIERPKPLPAGSYICVVKGLPRFDKSSKKQTPFVEFTLQPLEALDDVDKEALEEMGGFNNKTIRATYYLTDDAAYRLKDFLDHCGIDEDGTLRQRIESTPGCQVVANLKHSPNMSGDGIRAELASTSAV